MLTCAQHVCGVELELFMGPAQHDRDVTFRGLESREFPGGR